MIALMVIALLLILVTAVMLVRLKFYVIYRDGLSAYAKVLWFKFYLTGEPEKPIDLKDFKIKRFRRKRDKVLRRYRSSIEKKQNKKNIQTKETQEKKKKKSFSSPPDLIETIRSLLEGILVRFPQYLHIDINRFVIEVGGDDAHSTALLYGGAVQGLQYLITSLDSCSKLKCTGGAQVGVAPNFLEKTFKSEVDIIAHIRVYGAISIGLKFLSNYFKAKSRRKTSVSKERTAK